MLPARLPCTVAVFPMACALRGTATKHCHGATSELVVAAVQPLSLPHLFCCVQNKMHINDWAAIQTLFDKLNKQLERTQKVG